MANKTYPIHQFVKKRLTEKVAIDLYEKLIEKKTEVQNRPQAAKQALLKLGNEKGGDEADQVNRLQEENQHMRRIQRDQKLLEQIMKALAKMENGEYGLCEITKETIEKKRLYSIPWTTLSAEGAAELALPMQRNIR